MNAIYDFLSTEGFQPHGFCLLWDPRIFWLHVVSDAVITLAYLTIPVVLLVLTLRRPDLAPRRVTVLFSAFIIACAGTHFMGIWTMWIPDYGVQGLVKAATALVSAYTAYSLWPLIPVLLRTPSIADYEARNAALQREIGAVRARDAEICRLNEELRAALDAEKHLNGLQRQFVSMVSHELRTPLAVIDGKARQIGRKATGPEAAETINRTEDIRRAVVRLTDIMESVLQSSRLEEGHIEVHRVTVDLEALVCELVGSAAETYRDWSISCLSGGDLLSLKADPVLMRQVIVNLLSNAVKYSNPGSNIAVRVWAEDGEARISVRDSGVGIPADEQDKIFTRFFRASTSVGRPGTGIGLHLVHHFVTLHGGRVTLQSVEGEGTTFTVHLPLEPMAVAA